ncbi:MAG: response regulator [Proteobacteria bacterium]|nr:response regulator [Pseudomonadota bacterium]
MSFIVIVDDRVTNRRIWAQLAAAVEPDAQVETFPDPVSALARLKEATPDLIITDFKMPEMDGAEFIRRIRKLPKAEDVPIIVVSVYEDREFRYQALEAGATDFLMSPVDHYEFRTRVRNLLILRRQQQMLRQRAVRLEGELATETRKHSEAMRQSRARLVAVIDTIPALVYASAAGGKCLFMNEYAATFFRLDAHEAVGKNLSELFDSEKAAIDRIKDEEILDGTTETTAYEETGRSVMGTAKTFFTIKSPLIDPETHERNVLTVSLDITQRKIMEDELKEAMALSEQASMAKTEFLANMSHELRTPLNAIIGFSDMMSHERLGPIGTPRYLEYASDIGDSAKHLLNIISDILDLARIEEGRLSLDEGEIDIRETMLQIERMMQPEAVTNEVALKTILPDSLPGMTGDARKIRQILINVIANALKYSQPGGEVTMRAAVSPDNAIEISVEDSGIGMTAEQIGVAKTRFGQVFDHHESKKYQGAGLGLPLAIGLAELHGGTVHVASEIDRGTKITISFPASRTLKHTQAKKVATGSNANE